MPIYTHGVTNQNKENLPANYPMKMIAAFHITGRSSLAMIVVGKP